MAKNIKSLVSLVGAGPGDAGLITLKGLERLRSATAIVYDSLVNPALLFCNHSNALKIDVGKRHKKDNTGPYWTQKKINALLIKLARKGNQVVRLKGGDPFIFGRGGEEAFALQKAGVKFEIVPGVSAASAVPAYSGIPITDRRFASQVTLVTGHEDPKKPESSIDWKALAQNPGTLVFFMGVQNLKAVCGRLVAAGYDKNKPAVVIQRGTFPDQKIVEGTVNNIGVRAAKAKLVSPALTIIGEVTRFRKKLNWFQPAKNLKLQGKTVLVTRPKAQASALTGLLEQHGAQVLELPSIDILPPKNSKPLDQATRNVKNFDWILFASVHSVRFFMESLKKAGRDARSLAGVKIAAIGPATAEALLEAGIRADFIPAKFTSGAMVSEMKKRFSIKGSRFLLPRTDIAPEELCQSLKAAGAQITQVIAYRTVKADQTGFKKTLRDVLLNKKIDAVTFTSSSTVKNFFDSLSEDLKTRMKHSAVRMVSIGPVTTQTLKTYGFKPWRQAKQHTVQGLVESMIQ